MNFCLINNMHIHRLLLISSLFTLLLSPLPVKSQSIMTAGHPAQLDIRPAADNSIRITLKPVSFTNNYPFSPGLAERNYQAPVISLRSVNTTIKKKVGNLYAEVRPNPLTVIITNAAGKRIQQLTFMEDGNLSFQLNDQPVLAPDPNVVLTGAGCPLNLTVAAVTIKWNHAGKVMPTARVTRLHCW
jgi:hypothetical protein